MRRSTTHGEFIAFKKLAVQKNNAARGAGGDLESHFDFSVSFGKTPRQQNHRMENNNKAKMTRKEGSLQEVPYLSPSPPQGRRIRVIRAQS